MGGRAPVSDPVKRMTTGWEAVGCMRRLIASMMPVALCVSSDCEGETGRQKQPVVACVPSSRGRVARAPA